MEHLSHLASVLARLREVNVKAKLEKCNFLKNMFSIWDLLYNYLFRENCNLKHIEWSTPFGVQENQKLLGLAGYYRRFLQSFAGIAKPLQCLTGDY